jgi:hypothetical protein
MFARRLVVAGLVAAVALAATATSAGAVEFASVSQSISTSTTQRQTDRFFRDGLTSTCGATLTPTLNGAGGTFGFVDHTFQSALTNPICVTAQVLPACSGGHEISSAAYAGVFDKANILTRYAARTGAAPPGSYSFEVGADEFFSVVVHEVAANAGCSSYTLKMSSQGPWATAKPSILGTPAVGTSITGTDAGWKPPAPAVQRVWRRCDVAGNDCSDIPGALGPSYTVADADLGHTLRFRNNATDADGTSTSESGVVEPFLPFDTRGTESLGVGDRIQKGLFIRNGVESRCGAPTSAPTILQPTEDFLFDTFPVGTLLNEPICLVIRARATCTGGITLSVYDPAFSPTAGIASNYAGNSGNSFTQEQAASVPLPPGGRREAVVSRGNTGGSCGQYAITLGADAPYASARPSVSGTPVEGGTLTASDGTWSGAPAFSRSWLRCDADGAGCTPIGGQTGATYTATAADVGRRLRVRITATQGKSVSSDSDPTGAVAAGPPLGGGPPGGGGTAQSPLDRTAPAARLALGRTTLQKVVKSGRLPVTVTCDEACTITLRAEVTTKLGKRLGGVRIATGKGTAQAGRRTTAKLKLTRKARKALRRRRSLAFTLKGTAVDAAGNSGAVSAKAKLKRARR